MKSRVKFLPLFFYGLAACLLAIFLGIMLGSVFISPTELIKAAFAKEPSAIKIIIVYSRFPRVMASLLAGAALSCSGAILQQVLANKLASPSIIGVNAGAGLGVTIAASFGIISGVAVSASAFLGSLVAVLLISIFAKSRLASRSTVILGGVALNAMLGAISESISVLDDDVAVLTTEFRVGGFSSISYARLMPAAIIILLSLIILFTLSNELDIVSLGDETAKGIGLSVNVYRIIFLVISALLAGAAISFAGLLGFIGLIIPHFVRTLVGSESRRLLPLSAIYGAAFVCISDMLSRVIFAPYELPVGMILSFIGAPVFVLILIKMKGGRSRV